VTGPRASRPDWEALPLGEHLLAECPRWDDARRRLSWVDILGGSVASATWDGRAWSGVRRLWPGRFPTGAQPLADGSLAVLVDGAVVVVGPHGQASRRVSVCPLFPQVRTNDVTVDSTGRLLVGLFTEDRVSAQGGVVAVDLGAESVVPLVEGYVTTNGLAVSSDGRDLYAVDTATGTVHRHRLDAGPAGPGVEVVSHDGPGLLDGLVLGPDGDLWVAVWDAGAVHRYQPDGRLREVLEVPVARPSALTIVPAGGGLRLVATTARTAPDVDAAHPESSAEGRLYWTALPD
jgi:sugar lactone lactonase YvrE